MTQANLVKHYETQLLKVQAHYANSPLHIAYIDKAKENLEAVKNGRAW